MNQTKTFAYAMILTACFTFANRLVIGSDPDIRPLAGSRGVATISECQVMARIESRPQGIYAVFSFENPTTVEKPITFNYLASRTPPMSKFSRMIPRPEIIKKGTLALQVKAGSSTEDVLLKDTTPAGSGLQKTDEEYGTPGTDTVVNVKTEMTQEIWTLVVSREEIKGIHGWGAVGPVPSDAPISLDKGEAILAVTIQEKSN